MRRGQRQSHPSIPHRNIPRGWFSTAAQHQPAPIGPRPLSEWTMPHRDARLLERLQAGDALFCDVNHNDRLFRVSKSAQHYEVAVKRATVERLVDMGYLRRVGVGYQLVRPSLATQQPPLDMAAMLARGVDNRIGKVAA